MPNRMTVVVLSTSLALCAGAATADEVQSMMAAETTLERPIAIAKADPARAADRFTSGHGSDIKATAGAKAKLCFEPRFILEAVARHMKVTLRPEVPVPAIFLESATPLRQLQVAVATQWRTLPRVFTNTYAIARNEIYLLDDPSHYAPHGRTLDDALAHELVHYLQASHLNEDFASEWREVEAVTVQEWFRREYANPLSNLSCR